MTQGTEVIILSSVMQSAVLYCLFLLKRDKHLTPPAPLHFSTLVTILIHSDLP